MRKLIIVALFMALLPSTLCQGARKEKPDTITARRAFIEMPAKALDLLTRNMRLDMLDYYDVDSIKGITNSLKGVSYLEKVSPDFLSVRLTPVSTMQFKVLPLKDGSRILMTIYTTGGEGEAKDSDIEFYDSDLKKLPREKIFPIPPLDIFFDFPKGTKTKMKEIEEIMPFYTVLLEANPDNDNIKAQLTLGDFLTIEDKKLVEMFVKPEVIFTWNNKKFK